MAIDKEASRRWRRQIRDILNSEWDPLGIAQDVTDEYDTYVGKLTAILREAASDDDLPRYLRWAETEHMGLRGDEAQLHRVIASIRSLGFMN